VNRLAEIVAEHDDEMLSSYVYDDPAVSYGQLRHKVEVQTTQALVHPVFFGSAITGAGVQPLIAGITEFLPASEATAMVLSPARCCSGRSCRCWLGCRRSRTDNNPLNRKEYLLHVVRRV
jgi:translation elongation factor EF-G